MLNVITIIIEFLRERLVWPRYGWLLIFAPSLIVLGAESLPSLLTGLLLLRMDQPGVAWRDLFILSWLTSSVVSFGIAQVRIVDLYGCLRFHPRGKRRKVVLHDPKDQRKTGWLWWHKDSSGWPLLIWFIWAGASIIYPIFSLHKTLLGASLPGSAFVPGDTWEHQSAIIVGLIATLVSFLILSLVQLAFSRTTISACGLMPMENAAARVLELVFKRPMETQPSNRKWLWVSPGFTAADSRVLLPGHAQLSVLFAMAICIYVLLFWQSYRHDGWPPQFLPVGVYVLLLVAGVGGLASWLAFLLGRFRIPLWLPVFGFVFAGWLFGSFLPIDTHRYFGLLQPTTPKQIQEKIESLSDDTSNAFINALKHRPTDVSNYPPRRKLYDIYDEWAFPKGPDGKRTMIVITASGGGIQAAAWTARVLFGLEGLIKDFRRSIGLISSVSGGSVGAMYYLAHRPTTQEGPAEGASQAAEVEIQQLLRNGPYSSSLEAVSWGLAFPDLVRTIFPFKGVFAPELDRGWSLESTWWNRIGRNAGDVDLMQELRIRDLIYPTNEHLIPPVVFNATAVETGQRVMISPVITSDVLSSEKSDHYELLTSPIDLLDYYEPLVVNPNAVNPRLTTAVRLSATFAYVTPVALPLIDHSALLRTDVDLPRQRLNVHLCDGGYSDNTGLVAAVRLLSELLSKYKDLEEDPPFDRIVIFCIEPFAESPIMVQPSKSGLVSGFLGPGLAISNARVTTQAERALLEQNLLVLANGSRLETLGSLTELNLLAQVQSDFGRLQQDAGTLAGALQSVDSDSSLNLLVQELKETSKPIENHSPTGLSIPEPIKATREVNVIRSRLSQPTLNLALTKDFAQTREAIAAVDAKAAEAWENLRTHFQSTSQSIERADQSKQAVASASSEDGQNKFKLNVEIRTAPIRFNPEAEYQSRKVVDNRKPSGRPDNNSQVKGRDGVAEPETDGSQPESIAKSSVSPTIGKISNAKVELNAVPSPPLSWVLSPWDQGRLNTAWQIQASRLMEAPQSIPAASDLAGQPEAPTLGSASKSDTPSATSDQMDPLKSGNVLAPLRNSALKPEGFRSIFETKTKSK